MRGKITLTTIILLFLCGVAWAILPSPPVIKEHEIYDYLKELYNNWNQIPIVTTDPNTTRVGQKGNIVAYNNLGSYSIKVNTSAPNGTTWVALAGGGSGSGASWGSITGDIANQLDLQNALNQRVATTRVISTTYPLQGGGDLSANRVLSIKQANSTSSGYITVTDWNTFNNKQPAGAYLVDGKKFVPYRGATGNVLLGSWDIKARAATGSILYATNAIILSSSLAPSSVAVNTISIFGLSTQGHTRPVYSDDDNTQVTIGRDNFVIGRNTTGSTITKGQVVYVTGSTGNVPNIALAQANSLTKLPAIGFAMSNITNNAFGYVQFSGILSQFNTSSFLSGDRLYVSPDTAGGLTNIRPSYPNIPQRMGSVLVSGIGNGSIDIVTAPFLGMEESGTNQTNYTFAGTASANILIARTSATTPVLHIGIPRIYSLPINTPSSGQVIVAQTGKQAIWQTLRTSSSPSSSTSSGAIVFTFDGGGSQIATNTYSWTKIPVSMTINSWEVTSISSGSVVMSVTKGQFPTATYISGTQKPTLTYRQKNSNLNPSTWTKTLVAGDYIGANIDSVDISSKAVLTILVTK